MPFSDWLHEALRQPAQHIYLSEVEYTLQFDKFEILSALAFGHQVSPGWWFQIGAFALRRENEGLIIQEIKDSLTSLAYRCPMVQSGLFGDTPEECLSSIQNFEGFMADFRGRWGIFW